jgi:two-component system response regulator AtoC
MANVLIVDDEPNMRWVLQEALEKAGYDVTTAASGEAALESLGKSPIDLVILDLKLKGMDGLSTLRQIHARRPGTVVLILTAYGSVATAVEAMQSGASDYLRKPFDVEEILFKVSRSLERHALQAEVRRLRATPPPALPGSAPAWRRAVEAVAQAVAQGFDVRLSGEPGSGRASLARAAHLAGPRREAPLVELDLATIPPAVQGLILAGEPGREGRWSAAGQGALLLRHIGTLSPTGAEALRGLVARRAEQGVGPLLLLTGAGDEWTAAEGLEHRFAAVALPPLREHADDILAFAAVWLPGWSITPAAIALLHVYPWPENLGELRGVLERAALLAQSESMAPGPTRNVIDDRHLPDRVRAAPLPETPFRLPQEGLSLEELEVALIKQALARAGGNKSRAAELLGLTRHTLLYRLEKYKIADPG